MIDYRQLDDLYKLKSFFDFFLDPKKLAQVQKDLTAQLAELDAKLGVVKSLEQVKQYESASNAALDKKSAQINKAADDLATAQAVFDQKVQDQTAQLTKTQAALKVQANDLAKQANDQAARAVQLNAQAVTLNNKQQSLDEQVTALAAAQRDIAEKTAKLKAIMG